MAKDGDFVTEMEETTESTSTCVLMQFTFVDDQSYNKKTTDELTQSNSIQFALDLNNTVLTAEQVDNLV